MMMITNVSEKRRRKKRRRDEKRVVVVGGGGAAEVGTWKKMAAAGLVVSISVSEAEKKGEK